MRKAFSILLTVAFVLSFTACAKSAKAAELRVDIFLYDLSDAYISNIREQMETRFSDLQVALTFHDGMNDQSVQSQQVEDAVADGTDLLIINIVSPESVDASLNMIRLAQHDDIPIIFFNREISSGIVNSYAKCAYVGTNPDDASILQGQLIFMLLKDNYAAHDVNGDGEISYIMFRGELANEEANSRTLHAVQHANELLATLDLPKLKYYDPDNPDCFEICDWKRELSKSAMQKALESHPFTGNSPIELVIANNDEMALGAIEALQEVGYNESKDKKILVVGIDATPQALAAIDTNQMSGTIKQDANGMATVIVFLVQNILNGEPLMNNAETRYSVDSDAAKIRVRKTHSIMLAPS